MHERLAKPAATEPIDVKALEAAVTQCMLRDQHILRGKIHRLVQLLRTGRPVSQLVGGIPPLPDQPRRRRAERQARLPRPTYPPGLPVVEKRDEIKAAIEKHQVIILCGETGSGKTTQLP